MEASAARDGDAARQHLGALLLGHRVGLAGQHRLVELEALDRAQDTVGGDLVTGDEVAEIVEDDFGHGHLPNGAVAHDARSRRVQYGQPVEGPLRAVLLDDTDQHVEQEDETEERVLALPEQEDEHEGGAEDRVEPGEDVGPQDLLERPAGALVGDVHAPVAHPLRHLLGGQPLGSRGRSGARDSGVAHRANATDIAPMRRAPIRRTVAQVHVLRAGTVTAL